MAPLGVGFTFLMLLTGAMWGRPMWGTYWQWTDARLVSALVLLLLFLGYMALNAAIDDEQKASRASNILAMVGVINLPIIKFSVTWWNSLHQGATFSFADLFSRSPSRNLAPDYVLPFVLNFVGFMALFAALWLVRTRAEVWRRRAGALAVQAAGRA